MTKFLKPRCRYQEAYDRFRQAVDAPMTVLAFLWLPVLVIPLVAKVHRGVDETLNAIDYTVWAIFVVVINELESHLTRV